MLHPTHLNIVPFTFLEAAILDFSEPKFYRQLFTYPTLYLHQNFVQKSISCFIKHIAILWHACLCRRPYWIFHYKIFILYTQQRPDYIDIQMLYLSAVCCPQGHFSILSPFGTPHGHFCTILLTKLSNKCSVLVSSYYQCKNYTYFSFSFYIEICIWKVALYVYP